MIASRSPFLRALPWIGFCACVLLTFAILYPWVCSFHVAGIAPFPSPVSRRFLVAILGPALIASQQLFLQSGSQAWYTVWLFWQSEGDAPMRLAWTRREDHARLFLAQASADLGVPILPDQPTIRT